MGQDAAEIPKGWRGYVIVFVVAFLVRLLFVTQSADELFFDVSGLDSNTYHSEAQGFVAGTWPGEGAFFRPPLYSLFRGAIYATLGEGVWTFKLVQSVLGALGCVLTFAIAGMLFPRSSVWVAYGAALVHVLHGALVYFDAQPLSAGLDVVLELAALWALLRAGQRPEARARWALGGALMALTALNRAGIVIFVPVVCIWLWRGVGPAMRRSALAFLLTPFVLLLLPVMWHNARFDEAPVRSDQQHIQDTSASAAMGRIARLRFAPIASNLGVNFYLGNHSRVGGRNNIHHPEHFELYSEIVDEPLDQGITGASQRSSYLVSATLADMVDNPKAWMRRLGQKAWRMMNGVEITRNSNLYAHREGSSLLAVLLWKIGVAFPSGLVIPLALLGLVYARGSGAGNTLVVWRLALHAVFLMGFFVTARYRLPALPVLGIYAAFAAETLVEAARAQERERLVRGGIALVMLLFACNVGVPVRDGHAPGEYYVLGLEVTRRGEFEKAVRVYRELLELEPTSIEGHDRLATNLMRLASVLESSSPEAAALFDEAERHYREAIGLAPGLALIHSHLGSLLFRRGRLDESLAAYDEALRLDPSFAHVHVNKGVVLEFRGEREAAIESYRTTLRIEPGNARARNKLEELLGR